MWYQDLELAVEKTATSEVFLRKLSSLDDLVLRKLTSISQPSQSREFRFIWNFKLSKFNVRTAIVLTWMVEDPYFRFELQSILRKRIKVLDLEERSEASELLESKHACYYYLGFELSVQTIFGNLLPNIFRLFEKIKYIEVKNRKPRQTVWRRGYRDHGSLSLDHQWKDKFFRYDEGFAETQRLYEDYLLSLKSSNFINMMFSCRKV